MNDLLKTAKLETKAFYDLSPAQKRLYLIQQFAPDSVAYNLTEVIPAYRGDLHRVEAAINELIKRYEILRTVFRDHNGRPVQVILEEGKIAINALRLETYDPDTVFRLLVRPFDLGAFPLLRLTSVQGGNDEAPLLFIEFHHIIFDARSVALFTELFNAVYAGKPVPLPERQYRDYSEWLLKARTPGQLARQQAFWKGCFPGPVPVLELPADFQRPAVKSDKGSAFTFALDPDTTLALNALAEGFETTLFTVLLGVFAVFLKRLTGQDDLVIGVPVSGRHHPGTGTMLGMFVNILPVRVQPADASGFVVFLKQLREHVKRCLDHQDLQFDEIVNSLHLPRDAARSPLFDVMFDMLDPGKPGSGHGSASETPVPAAMPVPAQYDLVLKAKAYDSAILFVFEYCTDLFAPATMLRYIGFFKEVLKALVRDPFLKPGETELLTEREKTRLLADFNNTALDYPRDKTIHALFEETAHRQGGATALVFGRESLSYDELNRKSNQLARHLLARGAGKEAIVGLLVPRSAEMIISLLAVLKAGCAYLPIDPEYPADRVEYMAADGGITLLLTTPALAGRFPGIRAGTIDVTAPEVYTGNPANPETDCGPTDLAYLIYTSGSTGRPKGVMIEHGNLVNFVYGVSARIPFAGGEAILCITTISFDIFVLESLLPLVKGMKVVLAGATEQKDPATLVKLMMEHSVAFLQITPSHLKLLLLNPDSALMLRNLKVLMVGGEAFPAELLAQVRRTYGGQLYNMYGPTETTVWSTIRELTGAATIDIGSPIANTTVRILNPGRKLQPVGLVGELCIGGAGVTRGYWQRQDLTDEKYIPDPFTGTGKLYRTGDLARWLPDGNIEFISRVDNQLKLRGFRIELGEIESLLAGYGAIGEAAAAVKEKGGNACLVAYYVAPHEVHAADLRQWLSGKLPDYMVPAYYMRLDYLPLTLNGKLDRKALPEPDLSEGAAPLPPATETEAALVRIWAEVLGLEPAEISTDKSFFELGGHSLNAPILLAGIAQELNVSFHLQTLVQFQTVSALAGYISRSLPVQLVE